MQPPSLFRQRPRAVQIMLGVVLPILYGGVCGFVLGSSEAVFGILMLIAGIAGVGGGYEHASGREGALRGLVGGVLFASALLVVFTVRGVPALAPLPAAMPVMAIIYAGSGVPLGALGGWLRGRTESQRARAIS